MKKVLAGGLLVLLGLWVITVGLFGRAAALKMDEQIAEINRDLAHRSIPVSLSKHFYQSGLLASTSRIQVSFDSGDKEPILFDVDLDIYHGPLMLSPNGLKFGAYYTLFTPDLPVALQKSDKVEKLLSGFAGADPLTGGVLIDFQGGQTFELALSPFELAGEQGSLRLENGITGSFSSDDQFSSLTGQVEFGALSAGDDTVKLDIAPSTLLLNITEMHAGNLLIGDTSYTLASANLQTEGAEHRIEHLSVNSLSDRNDSGLYGNMTMLVEAISSSDASFDAMFQGPLTARFDINYKGLDEQAVREYIDVNQKMQQQIYSALLRGDEADALKPLSEAETEAFVNTVIALFKQGFGFDYGISVTQGEQSSDFRLSIDWVDDESLEHKETLRDILGTLQSEMKMKVDKSLIGGTPLIHMVQIPIAMGYAVETESTIESQAQLQQGELTLNGQPLPYAQMLGAALDTTLPWHQ